MAPNPNHFDRAKPFYPVVVNYVCQLVGFKELIVRGFLGSPSLDQAARAAAERVGAKGASPAELKTFAEQLQKLMGPLEPRSEQQGGPITIDVDQIAQELKEHGADLIKTLLLSGGAVFIVAHESEKDKAWHDQGPLWEFLRHCRNAAGHGGRFHFLNGEPRRLARWGKIEIQASLEGTPLFKGADGVGLLSPGDPIRLLWDIEQAYPQMST
jgi:hypothetical protein